MRTQAIETDQAPPAIGPYSQAVRSGGFIFTSGQIPLDLNGQVVQGGVRAQTEQVFHNLKAILSAAGTDLSHVVKATVYLRNMDDFADVNAIYAKHFGQHKPARSTVEVARLPRDVFVEIDLIVADFVE